MRVRVKVKVRVRVRVRVLTLTLTLTLTRTLANQALLRHVDFGVVKCVVLAGPGFVKDQW